MTGVASMADFMRRAVFGHQPMLNDEVPEDIARALDASAEDVRNDRIVGIGDYLKNVKTRLEAHRARKASTRR